MAEFLKNEENFYIMLKSESHYKPYELYGNMISGTTYNVYFPNRNGEQTEYFANIIRSVVEREDDQLSNEKSKLAMLDKVLEENSNSDLVFQVLFNGKYQSHMNKSEKINKITIVTKAGEEKIEGNIKVQTERDMDVLASILTKKYNMNKMSDNAEEYPETEFIITECDKSSCSIYFTDEHFLEMLEIIQYIRQMEHTLPTFESREWIGSDEELFDEYSDEEWNIDEGLIEQDMSDDFEETPLSGREKN